MSQSNPIKQRIDAPVEFVMQSSGTLQIPWPQGVPLPPPNTPVYMNPHTCPKNCNCITAYYNNYKKTPKTKQNKE